MKCVLTLSDLMGIRTTVYFDLKFRPALLTFHSKKPATLVF